MMIFNTKVKNAIVSKVINRLINLKIINKSTSFSLKTPYNLAAKGSVVTNISPQNPF